MKLLHLLISGSLLWFGASSDALAEKHNDDVAIIIGNKAYQDKDIPEVLFAHNDALAMRKFVQNVYNIRDENIIYIEDATQAKMESAFGRKGNHRGRAFQYVKPDVSNLYVFYSGHGIPGQSDGRSYLLPVDAAIETAEINGFPIDLLYENLAKVEAKSVTIFLDACFSGNSHGGSLIKNASGARILPATPKDEEILKANMSVLTAASNDQLASWDEESQHGLFTEYLMRALYGEADQDQNGQVELAEVSQFLRQDMRYKARRTYNRDQVPTITGNEDQVMVAAVEGIFPARPEISRNETPSAPLEDHPDFELAPIDQEMLALKNANVRAKPDVSSPKIKTLRKGEAVHVIAKVEDSPWYAVEENDEIYGYVYEPLLGFESDDAEENEERIRELQERIAELEKQTKLGRSGELLPEPPVISQDDDEDELVGPDPNWTFEEKDPGEEIEFILKSMGALLAQQSFIKRVEDSSARTSLKYNWIRVHADQCALSASFDAHHDRRVYSGQGARSFTINDRQVKAVFSEKQERERRVLRIKNDKDDTVLKTVVLRFGPFRFSKRADLRQFASYARNLRQLCKETREARAEPYEYKRPDIIGAPPPVRRDRDVRPPPPPRHFGFPPPPRR